MNTGYSHPEGGGKGTPDHPSKKKNGRDQEGGGGEKAAKAVIYLPHLAHRGGDSTEDLATRIAAVLDSEDADALQTYVTRDAAQTARYGRRRPKESAESSSIAVESDTEKPVLDIYEFNYSKSFFDRFDERSTLGKSWSLLSTVALNLGRLIGSLVAGRSPENHRRLQVGVILSLALVTTTIIYFLPEPRADWRALPWIITANIIALSLVAAMSGTSTKLAVREGIGVAAAIGGLAILEFSSKATWAEVLGDALLMVGVLSLVYVSLRLANPDLGERTQLAIGFIAIALMTMYGVILVGAVIAQVWNAIDDKGADKKVVEEVADPLAAAALALAAAGVTIAPKKARKRLNDGTTHLLGAVRYLSMGEGRDSEVGRLYELIEHLAGQGYKRIDIVGYSFGSVLAVDALYPAKDGTAPKRVAEKVCTLVTIGCPAKTIGTFWPYYWEKRDLRSWPGRWINIYSPFDVLSSKFTNDEPTSGSADEAAVWMTPKNPDLKSPRPRDEKVFNSGPNTEDLSPMQAVALGGLRAHANYWRTPYENDRGAVALFGRIWADKSADASSEEDQAIKLGEPESPDELLAQGGE